MLFLKAHFLCEIFALSLEKNTLHLLILHIFTCTTFNPCLVNVFFVTRLPKGEWLTNLPYIFAVKRLILMILVPWDRYEPPLSIDAKNIPIALYLTSQWHVNGVRVTRNQISLILIEIKPIFQIFAKNPRKDTFTGLVGKVRKKAISRRKKEGRVEQKKARAARLQGPGLEPGTCRMLGEGPQLHAMGGCLDKQAFPCLQIG